MSAATITERQADLLVLFVKSNKPLGTMAILASLGHGRQSKDGVGAAFALDGLIEAGLVDRTSLRHKICTINAAGRAALIEHKRLRNLPKHSRAPASRDSLFDRAPYVPHAQAYYRNSGNSHIASRGAGC